MGAERPTVAVTIDGKEHILKFDYNAVADMEDKYGKGFFGLLREENMGFSIMRSLYWAGLKWKNKGLTLEAVGTMLGKELTDNGADWGELMKPLFKALKASKLLGDSGEDEGDGEAGEQDPN
jgi:hypothetical protein